jgi:hypothetical protein
MAQTSDLRTEVALDHGAQKVDDPLGEQRVPLEDLVNCVVCIRYQLWSCHDVPYCDGGRCSAKAGPEWGCGVVPGIVGCT